MKEAIQKYVVDRAGTAVSNLIEDYVVGGQVFERWFGLVERLENRANNIEGARVDAYPRVQEEGDR